MKCHQPSQQRKDEQDDFTYALILNQRNEAEIEKGKSYFPLLD